MSSDGEKANNQEPTKRKGNRPCDMCRRKKSTRCSDAWPSLQLLTVWQGVVSTPFLPDGVHLNIPRRRWRRTVWSLCETRIQLHIPAESDGRRSPTPLTMFPYNHPSHAWRLAGMLGMIRVYIMLTTEVMSNLLKPGSKLWRVSFESQMLRRVQTLQIPRQRSRRKTVSA
jgi:hypothetical protein